MISIFNNLCYGRSITKTIWKKLSHIELIDKIFYS